MTRDEQQCGEEVHGVRTLLANARRFAARETLAAPQAPEDRGQLFPDSLDLSGSDQTQVRCWIAQLRMVIRHKFACFRNEQSKLQYPFNSPNGVAL